jgi:3-methyladenine DNA glycosylase AlkD
MDRDWASTQVERIHQHLLGLADPDRAAWDRGYLHSERVHLGVAIPNIRASARQFQRELGELSHARMLALLEHAWASDVHDLLAVAVALLERWKKQLIPEDLIWIERWLVESQTWSLVDWLAVPILGSLVEREPDATHPVLDRWALESNFWLRRSAMLALLVPLRSGGGDFDRFARYAVAMLPMTREASAEARKFIDKTIGWILREVGRKRPELVRGFLAAHSSELAGLSVREAIKSLPAAERAEFGTPRKRSKSKPAP